MSSGVSVQLEPKALSADGSLVVALAVEADKKNDPFEMSKETLVIWDAVSGKKIGEASVE